MDIVHELIARTTPERIYQVLTEPAYLAAWFTPDTQADPELTVGSVVDFRFNRGVIRIEVTELEPNHKVVWKVLAGLPGWEGVTGEITWLLTTPYDSGTMVHYTHSGWKSMQGPYPSSNFMIGTYIQKMKTLAETGIPTPA